MGKPVTLHWTPGYQGIPRNQLADQTVKRAAQQPCRNSTISLLYTKKRIYKKYKQEPQNSLLLNSKRSLVICYLQLKSGHALTGSYLQRFGIEDTATCWWCGERKQTVQHLFFSCRKWTQPRRKLLKALQKERGTPPTGSEGDLQVLFSDRLIPHCLKFLSDTQVGLRGGIRAEENQADTWDIHLLDPGERSG